MFYKEERRYTNLLCEYWNKVRGERHHPSLDDIKSEQISDIWDYCFIVQYVDDNYKVTHIGSMIEDAYEADLNISNDAPIIRIDSIDNIRCYLDEVIESQEALIEESECEDLDGNTIKFRQCFLPLGKDDKVVDAVIGALRYKIFSKL